MTYCCYVAGPYTIGDPEKNTYAAIEVGDQIIREFWPDLMPIVPHLSHWWNGSVKYDYGFWIAYTMEQAKRCDIMLRIPGESKGADGEVMEFCQLGKPVVYSLFDLGEWLYWKRRYDDGDETPVVKPGRGLCRSLRQVARKLTGQPDDAFGSKDNRGASNCGSGDAGKDSQCGLVNSTHGSTPVMEEVQ